MATLDAYVSVDTTGAGAWNTTYIVQADTDVIVSETPDGLYQEQYWGSFTYNLSGNLTGGTLNEFYAATRTDGDSDFTLIFSITDTSANLATLFNYINSGDDKGTWAYLCRESDLIMGSNFNDRMNGFLGNDEILGYGGNDTLRGNGGSDAINGGAGDDVINGGTGADELNGSTGADIFVFNSPLSSAKNVDVIIGFSHTNDTIRLDDDVFVKLATGKNHTLPAAQYRENSTGAAADADDRIIYDTSDGALYYDPDGTGPVVAKKFALIDGDPDDVDQTDFVVVI